MTVQLEVTSDDLDYLYYVVEYDLEGFLSTASKDDEDEVTRIKGLLERIRELQDDCFNAQS
jgi:hypothetical protein